jgi:4-amino-4-deoxy-L-arabinose transferase-like glycosyltransferase
MDKLLIIVLCILAIVAGTFLFPDGPVAVLFGGLLAAIVLMILSNQPDDKEFLLKVFLGALVLRILAAICIYSLSLQEFFGPDSVTYDFQGYVLSGYWSGDIPANYPDLPGIMNSKKSGWGMAYIVAGIYYITGQNNLAVQFFCSVLGAATAIATYFCAVSIFSNRRVARVSSLIVALSPSMILWSSQALKDGMIVFLLVLSILTVMRLQKGFHYISFVLLMISLFAILSLRFYIFYMLVVAIIGCFTVGGSLTSGSMIKRIMIMLVIGLALTSLGGTTNTSSDLSQFNLEKVQATRDDLARGNAGFGKDLDVSTTEGALTALPLGLLYLMLAPFPWQLGNLRQVITMPEMLLWWSSIPFLISGIWYSIKHRLRSSIAVLLFTLMLTIAYSLYQGNVGTAYRQRAQIQIFHFMFIAVGWTIWKEKRENEKILKDSRKGRLK